MSTTIKTEEGVLESPNPTIQNSLENNFNSLAKNSYPGRGIVAGLDQAGKEWIQVYWIMGRSENSRNRIFVQEENQFVKTRAYDESKMTDPSLIIYYPIKVYNQSHIVSNGDQTDTIYEYLSQNKTFAEALMTREYEPDSPNFTPRISALMDLNNSHLAYQISILKSHNNTTSDSHKYFFTYEKGICGVGHMITTYESDGTPLPSFKGEPRLVPLIGSLNSIAENYWNALNNENRVSLLVKSINKDSGVVKLVIINRH